MNLNLDLKNLDLKKALPLLKRSQVYIFGIALIAVFAYTAYAVNQALNIKPDTATVEAQAAASPAPKIIFNKTVITSLKNLKEVDSNVPTGNLGTADPFQ